MLATPPIRKVVLAISVFVFCVATKGTVYFPAKTSFHTLPAINSPSPATVPKTRPIFLQAPQTLLALRFDNSLLGEQGENIVRPATLDYQSDANSLTNPAFRVRSGTRLSYESAGNINPLEGTIEVWIKPEWNGNDGLSHTIMSFGSNGGIAFGKEGNNLRMVLNRANPNGTLEVDATANIENWQANRWHYVAASWSNTKQFIRLYIDGTLVSERNLAISSLPAIDTTANPSLDIGGLIVRNPILSTIDDFVITDAALPTQTIVNNMLYKLRDLTYAPAPAITPPAITPITMYPGWSSWQDLQYKVRMQKTFSVINPEPNPPTLTTVFYDLVLPFQAAELSNAAPNIANVDGETGRIQAKAAGSTTITATLNSVPTTIPVTVLPVIKSSEVTAGGTAYNDPNKPLANAQFKIPVVIIRYLPMLDNANLDSAKTGVTSTLTELFTKQVNTEKNLKFTLEEGSRFRGYKNAEAVPSLGYSVVKVINIYEEIPPGLPSKETANIFLITNKFYNALRSTLLIS